MFSKHFKKRRYIAFCYANATKKKKIHYTEKSILLQKLQFSKIIIEYVEVNAKVEQETKNV